MAGRLSVRIAGILVGGRIVIAIVSLREAWLNESDPAERKTGG